MGKTKRGPALFELLEADRREKRETLKVPAWWPKGRIPKQDSGLKLVSEEEPPAKEAARVVRPPAAAGDTAESEPAPFIALERGQVRLSFTSTTAAVAVFVVVIVVLGAFEWGSRRGERFGARRGYELGRSSYAADAAGAIEAARQQPAAPGLVASLLDEPAAAIAGNADAARASDAQAEGGGWVRDNTYIVVQEFSAEYAADAEEAQAFLAQRGVSTAKVVLPTGAIQLITTQGYNHRDPTQKRIGRQLLEKVHGIGEEYYAEGGGYKLQGYFKTLKGESW